MVDLQPSSAAQLDDKPVVDPPELDAEGLVRDTDETPGWIPGTFPTIFQNETGDPHKYLLKKPDLESWGLHVMRSQGWRAQAHMTFMYWWTNMRQRLKALGAKKWFVKDNPKATGYTVDELKAMSAGNLAKKMVGYTQNIAGTRGSKSKIRRIILDMVRQIEIETRSANGSLGDVPCLFGTLTSQRYHWDGIIRAIAEMEGEPVGAYKGFSESKRRQLVNKYPLFVAWYCAVRLELSLKTLVVPVFGASNYVAVFEWSPSGGMVHLHFILWREGAPRFDLQAERLLDKAKALRKAGMLTAAYAQTEKMDDMLDFFERYVSEWNPNKDGSGKDLLDVEAERVNRANVRHTAATSVEEMLALLEEDQGEARREHYMRMVRLEQLHDYHHPDPLGPPNPCQACARLLKGSGNMYYCANGMPKDLVLTRSEQSIAQDPLRMDLWRCHLSRNCQVMNSHMPVVSFGHQSNTDAQPIATKKQAEMYCCKYCAKHHKNIGARCAIFDILEAMESKDLHGVEKHGHTWQPTTLGGQLHKAFMAEIGEEMCQAEVAHHANHLPEFLVSRKVRHVHLYRKMLAITVPTAKNAKDGEGEYWDGAEDLEEPGQRRIHRASDIELYEARTELPFWDEEYPQSPRPLKRSLPWKPTPREQLEEMSLFDFFRLVHYHGGKTPYLSWHDPTDMQPSALPIVCLQPRVHLREGAGFARNAQWALVQYHAWQNRSDRMLATNDLGEPADPETIKDYFRNWIDSGNCPWYLKEQYDHDNNRKFRQARSPTTAVDATAGEENPAASSQQHNGLRPGDANTDAVTSASGLEQTSGRDSVNVVAEESCDDTGDEAVSETESSEHEPAPEGTRLLRQLRGSTQLDEINRLPEVQRKVCAGRHEHTFYRNTKVTSRAQEEQSAIPAGVRNVMDDSDDELCDAGDSKELEKEMLALKVAAKWLTDRPEMQNRDAGAEAKVIAENGVEVDLRQPRDASGHALSWDDVKRMLESDTATGNTASTSVFAVDRATVLRDHALDDLDPTQRAFADRVLKWGDDLVEKYQQNQRVRSGKKLKRVPLLRCFLGGSAGSGKSTTLRTVLQHLRLKFQAAKIDAEVELTAYTGVAAFNIGFGAKTACSAFDIYQKTSFKKELQGDRCRALEESWKNVTLLIVDEISFIGTGFFHKMHCRLQQAKRAYFAERGLDPNHYTFGDVSIILVGDFGQLDPIGDISLCDTETTRHTCPQDVNPTQNWGHVHRGRELFKTFREAFMLKRIHRSKDDLWWTQSCLRLRDFNMDFEQDYKVWLKHDLHRGHFTQEQKDYFHHQAVWLCSRCEDVGEVNGRKLAERALDSQLLVHRINAVHDGKESTSKKARMQPSSAFDGLRATIHLVRGCKVLITRNIAYKYGLANGTRGTLVGVVYASDAKLGSFPEVVVVEVPGYCGPVFYPGQPKWVPILAKRSIKEGTNQTRRQFPVTAGYALTINKAQGLTLSEGVVIKLSSGARFKAAGKHGLPFVAFTRSENFARTAFHNLPPWDDFAKGKTSEMLRIRLEYTAYLDEVHAKTIKHVFANGQQEEKAFREWQTAQRSKRKAKGSTNTRCMCPGCQAEFPE